MEKEVHHFDPHPHTTLNNQCPVIIYSFSKTGSSGSCVKADLGTQAAPTHGLTHWPTVPSLMCPQVRGCLPRQEEKSPRRGLWIDRRCFTLWHLHVLAGCFKECPWESKNDPSSQEAAWILRADYNPRTSLPAGVRCLLGNLFWGAPKILAINI